MLIRTRHIDRPALNKSGQFIAFNYERVVGVPSICESNWLGHELFKKSGTLDFSVFNIWDTFSSILRYLRVQCLAVLACNCLL